MIANLCPSGCSNRERKQLRDALVSIQLQLGEGCGVILDWLADATLLAAQLHRALHLERRWVGGVAGNANEDEPFLVCACPVVDNLRSNKGGMTVEDVLRRRGLV